jgi:hypothetical protein
MTPLQFLLSMNNHRVTPPASPPILRNMTTNTGAISSTAWTVNKPTTAVGDYMIVVVSVNDTAVPPTPTGWTKINSAVSTADANVLIAFGKIVDGTEPTTLTGTIVQTSFNNWVAYAMSWSNVYTTPLDDSQASLSSAAGAKAFSNNCASALNHYLNEINLLFHACDVTAANGTAPVYNTPTGWTLVLETPSQRNVTNIFFATKTNTAVNTNPPVTVVTGTATATMGFNSINISLRSPTSV